MRKEKRFILSNTKFEVFISLCKTNIFKVEFQYNAHKFCKKEGEDGKTLFTMISEISFFTVLVNTVHQKCLKFERLRKYKFIWYPKWLFKYYESIYKNLSNQCFNLSKNSTFSPIYFDDSYVATDNDFECQKNNNATVGLLSKLDFVIHSDETILKPTQKTEFLGFAIDSVWLFHWLVKRWKAKICYT